MTRPILIIGLAFCFALVTFAQDPAPGGHTIPTKAVLTREQSQKIIIATENKLWEAWKNKDSKAFKDNLAAESVIIGDGGVSTKTESLKEIESMPCQIKSFELTNIKISFITNETAILTYKAVHDGSCDGQPLPAKVWASSTYVKRGLRWWAASHQETPARD
jgi:hypothetical protein